MGKSYYPVMLDLAGRTALVVGGGEVARRKAADLLAAGARVRVVAPRICPALGEMAESEQLEIAQQEYAADDLDEVVLAVAATDSREVNAQVASDCEAYSVWCNVVDDPELCSFIVPAVVRRGPLVIAVSTCGASPTAAGRIARQIEAAFGPEYGAWLEALAAARAAVQSQVGDEARRREVLQRLAEDDVRAAAAAGRAALDEKVRQILGEFGVSE
jgi:precorrin-2 dehydrogenase / sirohydrochlorin ferrochelatase